MADLKITTRPPKGRAAKRWGWRCLSGALALVLLAGIGIGVAAIRLSNGPMRIDGLSARVAEAVAERIGPGWSIAIRGSSLELDRDNALALRFAGLDIRNPQGALVVRAPLALVSLDPWGLLQLSLKPRSIEFRDTQTTALIHKDGSIAFAASEAARPADVEPHTPPSVDAARGTVSPLSAALASIFGVVLDSGGVVGALDRARITDAKMRLIDEDGRERAVFARVNGLFGRDPVNGTRSFELRLDGPHGEWRFGGSLHENGDGVRAGRITLDDLPVSDLLLLAGQSGLPLTTDLKLSAQADVGLNNGRITTMNARVHTGDGMFLIEEKDFNPVTIDDLTASLTWDETARTMALTGLDYSGGGNAFHLTGNWAQSPPGADSAWTASLTSRDGTLRGATAKDAPVRIDSLVTRLTGRAGGIVIDDFALEGSGVKGHITGTVGTDTDDGGINLRIVASEGEVRTFLRLWPEHIAPGVRYYLADQLRGGRVDGADIKVVMNGREIAEATKGAPLPDKGLNITFKVSNAAIDVSSEAPPLVKGAVTGLITGRTTTVRGVTGEVKGPDGRSLRLSDGSFVIPEAVVPDHVVAQIGLRLSGGADGLASVLESKLFRSLLSVDLDPATIKGSADLRVDFPLDLKHIPDLADIPITLSGTIADLSVDKVMGKDRLEAGRFAVAYDKGSFSLKGDGKVGGAPIAVDMHQPKIGAPGEAVVTLTLDEALRARKGLPVAPQLAGPVPVKAVVAIGKPGAGKAPIRVEADLTKAGIDGLLPGFTKGAGKAGKLAFSLSDREGGYDLRDIALDAGQTSARGSAIISSEGGLERAELNTLKLSPGDDLKVVLDKSGNGYKVTVRGAVVDARPFLKSMTGPEGKGGKDAGAKDVEADIQVPIVTGFNDEALTSANFKLSLHGRDLRAGTIAGRFRAAPLVASVTRGERGAPTLAVESADAGATLRFLDIYRRMYGGKLAAGIGLNDGPQAGVVQIRDFALRNEPALSSIMAQGPDPVEGETARGRKAQAANAQPTSSVTFDRMRANFVRSGTRVDFSDAAISNAALGFTLSGWLDTGKERADINGTFVPLYGLNNVAAQLPIVGPLLGGGNNEGLFAVNFRVSGRLSSPDVTVNPLSAIAPGFLRKLFSAGGGPFAEGAQGGAPASR